MKKRLYPTILLCCLLFTSLDAQAPYNPPCPTNQEPPADLCGQTCIYCTFSEILSTTNGYTSQPPANFCGTIENEQWVAFIAGESSATITIIPSNCATGNGVQMALYPSCDATAPIACDGGASGFGNVPTSMMVNLNPGQTYYLMIDGFAGDQCDFTLSAAPLTAFQSPPVGTTGDIQGPDVICDNADVWYQLADAVSGAGAYTWSAPPGWTINGQPSPVTVLAKDGYGVVVNANGNAGGLLCVLPYNSCSVGEQVCKNISLQTGGYVYLDANANGVQDADEPPAAGLEVVTSAGQVYITDSEGLFHLPVSVPGDTLSIINLTNSVGTNPGFHIIGPKPYDCYDFGVLPAPGVANGLVYWDLNGDTIFNGDDQPATNRIVQANGQAAQFTGSKGDFRFSNLSPGDSIWVTLPLNASSSIPEFQVYKDSVTGGYDFALTPSPVNVNGYVYYDFNNNGIFDGLDIRQPGVSVYSSSGALVTTNGNGAYEFQMLDAGDTIRVIPQGPPSVSNPAFHVVKFQQNGTVNTFDFALSPTFNNVDLSIVLSNSEVFRPGFFTTLVALVRNTQGPASNVEAKIVLPNWLSLYDSYPFPTNINGDTICWSIGAMSPGKLTSITIILYTPTDTPVEDSVNIQGWVLPLSPDQFPQNNFYLLQRAVDKLISTWKPLLSNERLQVHPNPVYDRLFIQWTTPAKAGDQLQLYNAQGRLIKTQRVAAQTLAMEWGIAGVQPGAYVVVLVTNGTVLHQSIIVEQ